MKELKIYSDINPSLTLKTINSNVFTMILPITIENILQMSAGIVSMGMVGRIDVLSVATIGISMRIAQMIWAIFKGIAVGATVYVAQYKGAGENERMKNVIQQTLLSGFLLVVTLSAIVFFNAPFLLSVFNPEPKLLLSATEYTKIISFGLPFLAIMLIVGGALQGMGKAKTSMIITGTMNIVNIIVGYILIYGKCGFPPMGVKGAAIATVISQAVAAFAGLIILFNPNGVMSYRFRIAFFKPHMKQIEAIYKVGLPSSLEFVFWQLTAILLSRATLAYGEIPYAAYQLGLQVESISFLPAAAFGVAATALIGQSLGARDKTLAKSYLRQIFLFCFSITVFSSACLLLFPHQMIGLLTNNRDVIRLGAIYLIIMGTVQLPANLSGVLSGALRGAGHTRIPMIVAGLGLWGIRVPLALIVAYLLHLSIVYIWWAMAIDLAFRFFLSLFLFKKNNIYESTLMD